MNSFVVARDFQGAPITADHRMAQRHRQHMGQGESV
jgi:hypothetical protein